MSTSRNRTPASSPPPPSSPSARRTPTKPPSLHIQSPPITPPLLSPPLQRSVSIASTSSTSSNRLSYGRTPSGEMKRRGFTRPEGTEFSNSARARESVMALGSIAHLQYFFAKTGLLDGKGGGLKHRKSTTDQGRLTVDTTLQLQDSTYSSLRSSPDFLEPFDQDQAFFTESPAEEFDIDESFMLDPTTSTYNFQLKTLPPTPDPEVLRRQLREALAVTKRAWRQSIPDKIGITDDGGGENVPQGVYDLHCTELTDLATSAVRAAKGYYYTTDISLLSSKDEKTLREEFLFVLDVLKRMAQRKFEGGVKEDEQEAVIKWIESVEVSLDEEERDIAEMRRLGRQWLEGDWSGRHARRLPHTPNTSIPSESRPSTRAGETTNPITGSGLTSFPKDRNHLFMSYFDSSVDKLPEPDEVTADTELPTPFLKALQTGLHLILIHNNVVRRSKRPFGQIPHFHKEFSKPYRLAENLRYWKKAAELRWEVKLKFDVMSVVNGTSQQAWREFNEAISLWCDTVLKEVRQDWEMGEGAAAVGEGAMEAAARKRTRTLTLKAQAEADARRAAKAAVEQAAKETKE